VWVEFSAIASRSCRLNTITPAECAERLFTSPNPVSGSLPPSSPIAWVVFAHGTVFVTVPRARLPVTATPAQLVQAARETLAQYAPRAGTPSADFDATRLTAWFPDDPVWHVSFTHPEIVAIVLSDASDEDKLPLGAARAEIAGRLQCQRDLTEGTILVARAFGRRRSSTTS
jgi:hypothetical protein